MKRFFHCALLLLLLGAISCEKEVIEPAVVVVEPEPEPEPVPAVDTIRYDYVGGYVQKGPYLNGTSIQLVELDDQLAPTGKNFQTQIVDNRGTFEVRNVEFVSPYVQLKADGFYFNEVTGENSAAQLTLYALSNLEDYSALNVNLLTTLERARVDYLVSRGSAFGPAKLQAQREILDIFEMSNADVAKSELLDITKGGDDNARLLAMSVILQGYLSVADLSELVANLSTDLRADGVLNSDRLGSTLVNNAVALDLPAARKHLEERLDELGLETTIDDFETHVQHFLDNTEFAHTDTIQYPVQGEYGPNLLAGERTDFAAGTYSLLAKLPRKTSLRVRISGPNWTWWNIGSSSWEETYFDNAHFAREYTIASPIEIADLEIRLYERDPWPGQERDGPIVNPPDSTGYVNPNPDQPTDTTRIIVYENGSEVPSWTKKFVLKSE
ncbi:hypothetical protein CLV84_1387 [Neolewinella xylanilytica]|uniref:Uncharacterized protein n=1 Tax=Neolewinella xylanilytica TaxID=1514080 RepID=A0A2S6IA95_9BACT|nr:hypothetical protein [Neolewinella xylanilytica]PPK88420.1 hypothetical protein CLV84_1387 [Neolewinella xylanilytica]